MIGRRKFLSAASAASLGLVAGAPGIRRASAAAGGAKHLVVVFASGGWDTTYSIEPKPDSAYDIPAGSLQSFSGIPVWTDPSRPAAAAFFAANAASTCVVNGIAVRSISHPECTRRMLTGLPGSGHPDLAAISGAVLGADMPIGYVMLGGVGFTGALAASSGRVGLTNQISALLDDTAAYPPLAGGVDARFVPTSSEEAAIRDFVVARAEHERNGRAAVGYNAARVDDFVASLSRADALRGHADDFGPRGVSRTFSQQNALTATLLSSGIAWSVTIDPALSLDTHDTNADQAVQQEELFAGLSELIDLLRGTDGTAGGSLFDESVIVVVSELTRTPRLNAAQGKDHWPVASAMVIGPTVAGGRAIGGTSESGEALDVDLDDGSPGSGTTLTPANFAAGVLELAGVEPKDFYPDSEPLHALRA